MKNERWMYEVMSDSELDQVNGGTLSEVYDVARALTAVKSNPGIVRAIGPAVGKVAELLQEIPVAKVVSPLNIALREAVSEALNDIGIKSDLSVGFLGTGGGAYTNRYERNGQRMTHNQVLTFIGNL